MIRPARRSRYDEDVIGSTKRRAISSALANRYSGALSLIQRVAKVVLPAPLGPATIRMVGKTPSHS